MLPGRTNVTENTTGRADSLQFLVNLALLFSAANQPREFMVTLCDWLSPKVRQYRHRRRLVDIQSYKT